MFCFFVWMCFFFLFLFSQFQMFCTPLHRGSLMHTLALFVSLHVYYTVNTSALFVWPCKNLKWLKMLILDSEDRLPCHTGYMQQGILQGISGGKNILQSLIRQYTVRSQQVMYCFKLSREEDSNQLVVFLLNDCTPLQVHHDK